MTAQNAFARLTEGAVLSKKDLLALLETEELDEALQKAAREKAKKQFGNGIYLRGLIEISSYCKNDCFYCGLRCSNKNAARYRLTEEEILSACKMGDEEGIRTFVLQGGEDPWFTKERVVHLVSRIKEEYPHAAVTLSLGERSREDYAAFRGAGADRYLLRHETANPQHYGKLHPSVMHLESRIECLKALKSLGYQVGAGFMVGSPYQTMEHIAEDLLFLQAFQPHMIGIGPFLPQKDTPFGERAAGSLALTLKLISILRLMHPKALLPATTALATLSETGREQGILRGANVVMPNLSPASVRGKYSIYDKKVFEGLLEVREKITSIGYEILNVRGDYQ